LPLSRQDLAEMAGTTLSTVSRLISRWEAAGVVETGRGWILLLGPERLVAIAEELPEPPGEA
jgi:CRP-like cAMP-binding protein